MKRRRLTGLDTLEIQRRYHIAEAAEVVDRIMQICIDRVIDTSLCCRRAGVFMAQALESTRGALTGAQLWPISALADWPLETILKGMRESKFENGDPRTAEPPCKPGCVQLRGKNLLPAEPAAKRLRKRAKSIEARIFRRCYHCVRDCKLGQTTCPHRADREEDSKSEADGEEDSESEASQDEGDA